MSKKNINPYVAGTSIRGDSGFFGRQADISRVARELHNPSVNSIVIAGQRRIGKTSLLLQLQRILPQNEFLPIYLDLLDKASNPLGKLLADLADNATLSVNIGSAPARLFDDEGRFFRLSFLPALYHVLPENCRPVFLLDEFDVLDQVTEDELPMNAASKALLPFLNSLMMDDNRLAFIFVIGRRPSDLAINITATFKASLKIPIWVLNREDTENLIRQAEKNQTLRFEESAVEAIYRLCNGHPYLTQLLCQRIWEKAHAEAELPPTPTIREIEVINAIPDALESGEHALNWLWDGLSNAEKIYASAIAATAADGDSISEHEVIQLITTNASRLRSYDVELAPKDLVERQVLEQVNVGGENRYKFAIELFRTWVRKKKTLDIVKDELDKVNLFANRIFNLGKDFYNRTEWAKAADSFRQALEYHPSHLRARLYLGESLLRLGKTDDAVVEYKRAYEQDKLDAQFSYARALIQLATERWHNGKGQEALNACQLALQVSPNENKANELITTIWMKRGEEAMQRHDLESALEAYKMAGAQQQIKNVEQFRQRKRISEIKNSIKQLEVDENWGEVVKQCAEMNHLFPDDAFWQTYLKRAQWRLTIQERYERAQVLIKQGKRGEATELLRQVVTQDLAYKDALKLLLKIVKNIDVDQIREALEKDKHLLIDQGNKIKEQEAIINSKDDEIINLNLNAKSIKAANSIASFLASIIKFVLAIGVLAVMAVVWIVEKLGESDHKN